MTMNSSGPISLAGSTAGVSIEVELGGAGTTQISLNCTTVRTLAGVASGAITMPTNFYGKSNFTGNYYLNSIGFDSNFFPIYNSILDSSSNFYVANNDYTNSGLNITKYSSTGSVAWTKTYTNTLTSSSFNHGSYLFFDSSNYLNVFFYFTNGSSLYTFKIDSSTGLPVSGSGNTLTVSISGGSSPVFTSLITDSSGNYYVSGTYFSTYDKVFVAKLNSSFSTVWSTAYGYSANGYYYGQLGVDALGNTWFHTSRSSGSGPTSILMKFDSSGSLVWQYGGLPIINWVGNYTQDPLIITFDSSNNAYIVTNGGDVAIVSQSGTLVKYIRLSGQTINRAVQFDSSGNIYIIGYSSGGTGSYKSGINVTKLNSAGTSILMQRILNTNTNITLSGFSGQITSNGDMFLALSSPAYNNYVGRLPANGSYTGTYQSQGALGYAPLYSYSSSTQASITNPSYSLTASSLTSATAPTFTTPTGFAPPNVTTRSLGTSYYNNLSGFTSGYGSYTYMGAGTYSWVAPSCVTSISAVVIGSPAVGCGAGLAYKNNFSVTPGNSYTVNIPSPSPCNYFYFNSNSTVAVKNNTKYSGTGGGNGGSAASLGGGGAGGYSGNGGNAHANGSGGGGGGGGYYYYAGGGGGGVNVFGQGSNGTGGSSSTPNGGGGGSGGNNGTAGSHFCGCFSCPCNPQYSSSCGGSGGFFGGGLGQATGSYFNNCGKTPCTGVVRILWPGSSRSFPSTCVASP